MADCKNKIPIRLKKPIQSGDKWITEISIPCGKCAKCIERRKMEWAFRMEKEMEMSKTCYFVTLTYSPETIPYNKWGQKTLIPTRKKDLDIRKEVEGKKRITKKWKAQQIDRSLQGFFKRLRTYQERGKKTIESIYHGLDNKKDKIKYYAAGEYGEDKGRPHYHAIIFNTSERAIRKAWDLGNVHIVKANKYTIAYVMKYLDKQLGKTPEWKRVPEFNEMSEGIGSSYIKKNKQWHRQNLDVLYVTNHNGIKIPMPKYYRLKIFNEEERIKQIELVTNRLEEIKQDLIEELGWDMYAQVQREQPKVDEFIFKHKIKKRIVD